MKDTNIILRCTDSYKLSIKKEAEKLGMNVSQYFRFAELCRFYLEKEDPEFYRMLLESKYIDL